MQDHFIGLIKVILQSQLSLKNLALTVADNLLIIASVSVCSVNENY